MAPSTACDYLIGNVDTLKDRQEGDKPDFFREPSNYFGLNVTTVENTFGPHWHPNADEFDYFLAGEGRVGIVRIFNKDEPPEDSLVEFPVKRGDIILIPQGYAHYYINDGSPEHPLQFLAVFNNENFRVINTQQVPDISNEASRRTEAAA